MIVMKLIESDDLGAAFYVHTALMVIIAIVILKDVVWAGIISWPATRTRAVLRVLIARAKPHYIASNTGVKKYSASMIHLSVMMSCHILYQITRRVAVAYANTVTQRVGGCKVSHDAVVRLVQNDILQTSVLAIYAINDDVVLVTDLDTIIALPRRCDYGVLATAIGCKRDGIVAGARYGHIQFLRPGTASP
jgi:hypothetical protein